VTGGVSGSWNKCPASFTGRAFMPRKPRRLARWLPELALAGCGRGLRTDAALAAEAKEGTRAQARLMGAQRPLLPAAPGGPVPHDNPLRPGGAAFGGAPGGRGLQAAPWERGRDRARRVETAQRARCAARRAWPAQPGRPDLAEDLRQGQDQSRRVGRMKPGRVAAAPGGRSAPKARTAPPARRALRPSNT